MTLNRAASPLRWMVLALACLAMFGNYYSYDNPSVLNDQFESLYKINDLQFNLLYTVYSLPNIILPFFGGYFVDKLGTKITLVVFQTLITIGQGVFAFSANIVSFPLALVGRIIFGLGGESLSVGQSTLLALWFRGNEMAFAMAVNLSIARLGSVINNYATPAAYERWDIPAALWISFFLCVVSLIADFLLICVEQYAEKHALDSKSKKVADQTQALTAADASVQKDTLEERSSVGSSTSTIVTEEEHRDSSPAKPAEEIRLTDVKTFPPSFWLITLNCVLVYSAIFPFYSNASNLLQSDKYNVSVSASGRVQSIPFIMSSVSSPFLGAIIDKWGYRVILCNFSAVALAIAHGIMAFTNVNPILPFVIVGIGYSIYSSALWPCVAFVVKEHQTGTAYGVVFAAQNGVIAGVQLLYGYISTSNYYMWRELFSMCLSLVGVLVGIILNIVDARSDSVLNLPSVEAAVLAKKRFDEASQNDETHPLLQE